jgi:DNA-binding MarR family transcriptional regulator
MLPSSPVSICACASLRRASRAVNHLYDLVLAPTGLRISQFLILCAISESDEIAHCDLARRFFASEETFSRRLASARKAGWVQMNVDARRRRVYRLTEAGYALLRLALPNWERAQERLCRQLGEEDWSALVALAERVTMAAAAAENAPFRNSRPLLISDDAARTLDIRSNQAERLPVSQLASD